MPSLRRLDPLAVLAPLLLGACVAPSAGTAPARPRAGGERPVLIVPARQPEKMGLREARVHMAPGLEGVIGATPGELARQFGPARLDVWEGDARKLQFAGSACVLDIYLYPRTRTGEPQATYTEARGATGGDADRAACVAALKAGRR